MIGFTELLSDTTLDPLQSQFVELLKTSSDTLLTVINSILDYTKIQSDKLTLRIAECDAGKFAEEIVARLAPQARSRGLELTARVGPPQAGMILTDPDRLRQILGNLLGNALKFTEQGSIRLHMDPEPLNGQLRISITDTGIGIAREKQGRLFKCFTQADSSTTRTYGGTGLGLAITKRLVEAMGGQIGCESAVGRGSLFWFTLPRPKSQTVTATRGLPPESAAAAPAADRRLHALIVEDNFVNQQLARMHLQKLGCTIAVAFDGAKALELVQAQRYDLIFMDCMMPGMDGFATTRAIRMWESQNRPAPNPRVPIIALTANAMPGDREKCLDAGMDDYLSKPIIASQLAGMIERWRSAPTRMA